MGLHNSQLSTGERKKKDIQTEAKYGTCHLNSNKKSVRETTPINTLDEFCILLLLLSLSITLEHIVAPWPFFSFLISYAQSVGLLGWEISSKQGLCLYTGQEKCRINAHKHPCLEWDSNRRSQCLSGRGQLIPYTARPLRSAGLCLF
jgi:hypothetical protein